MPGRTPISKIMTTQVRTVGVDATLSDVRLLMVAEGFHHVPVLDGDTPVGVISSRDLVRIYLRPGSGCRGRADEGLDRASTLAETMSTDLVTMRSDESVDVAIDLVAEGAVHSVLVLDGEGRLVGIVTVIDLLDHLGG